VHDSEGTEIGQLEDLFVLPLGTRPQVTKFSLRRPDRDEWILPWASVAEAPESTDRPIRLRYPLASLSPVVLRAEEVPLGKTVLDKKVVDTARKKVVRVNDIELAEFEGGLQVTGIEGGLRGILRHLRSEGFAERLAALFGKPLPHDVVPWEVLDPVETELSRAKRQAVYTKLAKLHPADIADIMEELTPGERAAVLATLDEATAAETITEAQPEVQASMVQMMEPEKAADILEEMEPDEAADILSDLPDAKAECSNHGTAGARESNCSNTKICGGLPGTRGLPPALTAGEAISGFGRRPKTPDHHYLYVTDHRSACWACSVCAVILADPGHRLEQIMHARWSTSDRTPHCARSRSSRPSTTCWPCRWWAARVSCSGSSPWTMS
jgi:hypothetical protein